MGGSAVREAGLGGPSRACAQPAVRPRAAHWLTPPLPTAAWLTARRGCPLGAGQAGPRPAGPGGRRPRQWALVPGPQAPGQSLGRPAGSPRTLGRPAGSGPLSRTVTRLHSAPPHPRAPRGPLLFARSRATACTVCLAGAQVSGCDGGEGEGELPFELGVGEQVSGGRVLVGEGRGQPSGLGTGSQVNGGDGRGLCPKQEQVSTSEGLRHALR